MYESFRPLRAAVKSAMPAAGKARRRGDPGGAGKHPVARANPRRRGQAPGAAGTTCSRADPGAAANPARRRVDPPAAANPAQPCIAENHQSAVQWPEPMKRTLAVGIATLDIVNTVDEYPPEDAEIRAVSQQVRRGGNAANTAEVLSQLGCESRWLGVLADDADTRRITDSMDRSGIDYSRAPIVRGGKVPTSYITLSRRTGSRTIVHYRDLPELRREDFARVRLDDLDWLHFEGRNVDVLPDLIRDARTRAPALPISVEVEKPRDGIEAAAAPADVVFYSKAYAKASGFDDGAAFLESPAVSGICRGSDARRDAAARFGGIPAPLCFCAWGEYGAWLRTADGSVYHEQAVPLDHIVDTVGAGDVFNAAAIHALVTGAQPQAALAAANRLAAAKCARHGFAGVGCAR